ncbi:ABC transporter ATP-binding protein [Eubacterium sp. 1001713B170207_170306_E7]|uniref:ABC transporter ATP-binding protein n=1 Tax=Eubacterium sp. 1001713B170207_170306_E7 TaxID=2787097 RepID=UPI001899DFDB|nr:ABC transporter ATP-binding protein [Eubacterium sp. 1001713B170207_170306_E7]
MGSSVIQIHQLTKDYGKKHGVFNLDLEIKRGEIFGYVGTNGSGKTTTIRSLLGFIRPDQGSSSVLGYDSWRQSTNIMAHIAYIPGEIAFPSLATGADFLKLQAEYLGVRDFSYMNHVIELLQLDPSASLKRMSKGMKQKTAIAAALMANKEILILDEPTTGLDPLMREAFLELIREEKEKGRTIFMSSHIFEEIEDVCDRVAMIKDGEIIDTVDLRELRHPKTKTFSLQFAGQKDFNQFTTFWKTALKPQTDADAYQCTLEIPVSDIGALFHSLKDCTVTRLQEKHLTLEQYFMQIYQKGDH